MMKTIFITLMLICVSAVISAAETEARFPETEAGWGICGNFTRWGAMQTELELKRDKELGVNIVRMDFDWQYVEPKR